MLKKRVPLHPGFKYLFRDLDPLSPQAIPNIFIGALFMIFISYHILQTILAGKLQKSFKLRQPTVQDGKDP